MDHRMTPWKFITFFLHPRQKKEKIWPEKRKENTSITKVYSLYEVVGSSFEEVSCCCLFAFCSVSYGWIILCKINLSLQLYVS